MPTPTYTPLANITLGSTTTSVTFSSISQSYRDLVLVINGTSTSNTTDGVIRFNSDSGSNYNRVFFYGQGAGSGGAGQDSASVAGMFLRTTVGHFIYNIMDYSATDKHKTVLNRSDAANYATWASAGRWANTAAITSIYVAPSGASFASGTMLALYGIAS